MQPNSEPSAADIALVAQSLGQTPAQPAPAPQMQPETVTPQPSPQTPQAAPVDPFQALTVPPVATEVAQPTQPVQPTEQPTPQPGQTVEPAQSAPVQPVADEYDTFDEYLNKTLGQTQEVQTPDPSQVNAEDPASVKEYFDNLVNTAVAKATAATERKTTLHNAERRAWDEAFNKYGSLRENKPLRDMVHSIRMGYFQRNQAISPTQAADKLLDIMRNQYQQGVADNQVVTTIESVQPNAGGSSAPLTTGNDRQSMLESLQTGGETALAEYLDGQVKAGKL